MTSGLKSVRHRRDDALSRIGWARLERLMARHYQREGYAVEHVGTGGTHQRFDGGIDLKLRKGSAYVLVQCKHWNAKQVPHNAVHELLGLMVNERATGAVLVTSGEFTRAAIEAAGRQDRVRLVDGDALRVLLGPLLEDEAVDAVPAPQGPQGRRPSRMATSNDAWALGLLLLVLKIGFALALLWAMSSAFRRALAPILPQRPPVAETAPVARPAPRPVEQPAAMPRLPMARVPASSPTPDEVRESQRKADEAMRVIEATTPAL